MLEFNKIFYLLKLNLKNKLKIQQALVETAEVLQKSVTQSQLEEFFSVVRICQQSPCDMLNVIN